MVDVDVLVEGMIYTEDGYRIGPVAFNRREKTFRLLPDAERRERLTPHIGDQVLLSTTRLQSWGEHRILWVEISAPADEPTFHYL